MKSSSQFKRQGGCSYPVYVFSKYLQHLIVLEDLHTVAKIKCLLAKLCLSRSYNNMGVVQVDKFLQGYNVGSIWTTNVISINGDSQIV